MPGDRKSDCGARMKPIGLSVKDKTYNPFTEEISGELMVVHLCLGCGKVSGNRIAGDDSPYTLLELLVELPQKCEGLSLLTGEDRQMAEKCLFGSHFGSQ